MIQKYIDNKLNTLFILKGISSKTFEENFRVKSLLERYDKQETFDISNKDKKWLSECLNQLSLSKHNSYVTFEEFILLSELGETTLLLHLDELVIVVNNLYYDYYPCEFKDEDKPIVDDFIHYNENYDKENEMTNETIILSKYFIDIKKFDNRYYVCYKDPLSQATKKVNFYALDYELELPEIEGLIDKHFDMGTSSESLTSIIDYIRNNSEQSISIGSTKKNSETKEFIKKLQIHNITNTFYNPESLIVKTKPNYEYNNILKKTWGYDNFKEITIYSEPDENKNTTKISQSQIIDDMVTQSMLAFNNKNFGDIFITAPTGAGKSVIFQTSAIYLAEKINRLTIIISPLIALMKDQVNNLSRLNYTKSAYLNSELSFTEREKTIMEIKKGNVDIIYIAPETLINNPNIENIIGDREIGLFIIDESHIVTTWGKDFRPDYWYLGGYISKIRKNKNKFPICTFTATAVYGGYDDMYDEIIDSLGMNVVSKYLGDIRRNDISFGINKNIQTLGFEQYNKFKKDSLIDFIINTYFEGKKAIIYFPFAKTIEDIYLDKEIECYRDKITKYHAKLEDYKKEENLEDFKDGNKTIMLATKAFGMGIDIDNIDSVYHYAPTGNLNDYIQEIGRSARKQNMVGKAYTDFNEKDFKYINMLRSMTSINNSQLKEVLRKLYEIYSIRNKQNFLVTPSDFGYIFGSESQRGVQDLERKIKSVLLILENDMKNQYSFPALISKPQSMFTKSYVVIKSEKQEELLNSKYGHCFTLVKHGRYKDHDSQKTTVSDCGDIFSLDLKMLWEENYPNYPFGSFKYHLFNGANSKLQFPYKKDIYQRYKISINSEENISKLKALLMEHIEFLNVVLDKYLIDGEMFSKKDLAEKLNIKYKNKDMCKKIANSYMDLILPVQDDSKFNSKFVEFDNNRHKFRLINSKYRHVYKNHIGNSCILNRIDNVEAKEIVLFLSSSNNNPYNPFRALYLLELFGLAKYNIVGGDNPEIFIRINDPNKIARLSSPDHNYENKLLSNMKRKHNNSSKILTKFFTGNYTDTERWDFIENYFLGHNVLDEDKPD